MLFINFIQFQTMQVDMLGFFAIILSVVGTIINFNALKQSKSKIQEEHEANFARKEYVNEKLNVIDTRILGIDKEICADKAQNQRDHDAIKTDFLRQIDDVKTMSKQILDILINKKQ